MSETFLIAILGTAFTFLGILLGQYFERKKQSSLIKTEMLTPIDDWLTGAEKMVRIFSGTISAIAHNLPIETQYEFSERKRVFNFITENTNRVLGIIASDSLKTRKTKLLSKDLGETITALDMFIKLDLLPKENEVGERAKNGSLTEEHLISAGKLKMRADSLLQKAYQIQAEIKTKLI